MSARDAEIYWRYCESEATVSDLAKMFDLDKEDIWQIIEHYKRLEV